MLEVMRADYMRTARAKGLGERDVIYKHGLRNAMLPVVTLIGIDFGTVIGAAVLTETVYSWPGIGSEIANSITDRDLPVLLGSDPRRDHRLLVDQPAGRPVLRLLRPSDPSR